MERTDKLAIAKVILAPSIALFVAIVGWLLTSRYNATQLEVESKRGQANIEVARTNAAMRYIELIRNLPDAAQNQRRQAVAIAAPVLPPDLAFRLAIEQLPNESVALSSLMHKYEQEAFPYLARHLEIPFHKIRRALDPIPESGPNSTEPTPAESRATELLRYLRQRNHQHSLFRHLALKDSNNEELRATAFLLFFDEYRSSLRDDTGFQVQQMYERVRAEAEFQSFMRDRSLPERAKQSITLAAAIIFHRKHEYYSGPLIREAATRFWDDINVARGTTPVEGSLQSYVYEHVFGTDESVRVDAIALSSASLRGAIRTLDLAEVGFDNVRLILYAYAASPTVGGDSAYLLPSDIVGVMRVVLKWANTPEKRKALSGELGSLGGELIFRNMLPSSQRRRVYGGDKDEVDRLRCTAARAYAELLLDWYAKYHTPDWFIPKFLHGVSYEFPDLERRINREKWGLGASWPTESSRGCRK